ncbi:DUF6461 domain-containing protein [Herbidospora galbida]|uniref:DUF6461 domain-containing protein n=1 Tax=Herbidospora galbida TaxID=2575442 RepID=UPI0014854CEC|nr:DUF6461 domain-containing protein [Herbidospora galbida]
MRRVVARPGVPTFREWASANGHPVSARGRIPQHLAEAYFAAHPGGFAVRVSPRDFGVGPDLYDWPEDGPLGAHYAVLFVRGLAMRDVLLRLGAEATDLRLVSDEEVGGAEDVVRVAQSGDWTVAEHKGRSEGWREIAESLSSGGEAIVVQRNPVTEGVFVHAVDGRTSTMFVPSRPFERTGSAPDALNHHLHGLGIDPDVDDLIHNAVPAALALACRTSGVVVLDARLPGPDLYVESAIVYQEPTRLGAMLRSHGRR